jgi:hypothetical protein
LKSSRSRFYGVFPFLLLLVPGFLIPGCDLFDNSMVDYFLNNTGVVEVRGISGSSQYAVMANGTILIPPFTDEPVSILEAALSNPQNLSVRYQLVGVPPGKHITLRQAGSTTMELAIEGAVLGDEFDLTLVMQSSDGLREFASYTMRIRCVSFDTALSDFRVNDIHPLIDQNSVTVELPYETTEVTLEGKALESGAALRLFRGQDDTDTLIASGSDQVVTASPESLNLGDNFFYLEVNMSGAIQGYAVNIIRVQDPNKLITEFYFEISGKKYGVGPGVEAGSGSINGADIAVTVPYGTLLGSLAPTIAVSSGASSNPASGVGQDFTSAKTYTVIAADSSTAVYMVTVVEHSGITISGITVEGLNDLTFGNVPPSVSVSTSITVTTSGVVDDPGSGWYVDINGPVSLTSPTANSVTFTAPSVPGFYNVNVIATVGGIDYSGSFGLTVE